MDHRKEDAKGMTMSWWWENGHEGIMAAFSGAAGQAAESTTSTLQGQGAGVPSLPPVPGFPLPIHRSRI